MARDFRVTRLKGWLEFYNVPCDICGHTGMCMIHEDGQKIVCCRQESDYPFGTNGACPGHLHYLSGEKVRELNFDNIQMYDERNKQSDEHLNIIYQLMLKQCELTDEHLHHLTGSTRGMIEEDIKIRQYASFPEKPWEIVNNIVKKTHFKADDVLGVPGFYTAQGKQSRYININGGRNSILLPCRDTKKQIIGFQYRIQKVLNRLSVIEHDEEFKAVLIQQPNIICVTFKEQVIYEGEIDFEKKEYFHDDKRIGEVKLNKGSKYLWLSSAGKENGAGAGSPLPIHLAVPYQKMKEWRMGEEFPIGETVWVTEGILKADRIAQLLYDFKDNSVFKHQGLEEYGNSVWGIPGVGAYNLLVPILKEKGIKRVVMAYDMDATSNPYVKKHLFNFSKILKNDGIELHAAIWNVEEAKGLDELMQGNSLCTVVKIG